jgi:hypothetical protein
MVRYGWWSYDTLYRTCTSNVLGDLDLDFLLPAPGSLLQSEIWLIECTGGISL